MTLEQAQQAYQEAVKSRDNATPGYFRHADFRVQERLKDLIRAEIEERRAA